MIKDDPISMYAYAKENDMFKVKGWRTLYRMSHNLKFMKRMLMTSKSRKNEIRYKFGVRVPHNTQEAYMLDLQNGNTLLG
jgi:hypothetical protein